MEEPIVEISDGKLRGKLTKNHKGEPVYTFLGVPYAKPPIGKLRFKAPLPVEPWTGLRDAVQDGNPCYQKSLFTKSFIGSEDCLYLNVFTRSILNNQILKPVLFYIHGGAFVMGSNSTRMLLPSFLMMEDIVVVTINYRLGVLGFLSLNDTSLEVPGNAGLKDQLLALKWVQKNIEKFGGDPNNVTVSGTSAGAASVNYHVLSSASTGLFHKAVMQSGSVLNPWAVLHPKSLDIIKYLKISCKSEAQILETLRNIPVNDLIEAQNILEDDLDSSFRTFAPCVEKPNSTAFITRKPIDIITSGEYNQMPMLISYNSNEGLFVYMKSDEVEKVHRDLYIPQISLPDDKIQRSRLIEELREVYRSEKYKHNPYLAAGDSMFVAGIHGLAQNLANTCSQRIYLYVFDVIASRNKLRKMLKISNKISGSSHADDLGYLFDSTTFEDCPLVAGSIEDITMQRKVKFWTNFVKYGSPVVDQEDLKLVWQPVTKDTLHYLHFGKELTNGINPEEDRMRIWRKVYESHDDTKSFMPPLKKD